MARCVSPLATRRPRRCQAIRRRARRTRRYQALDALILLLIAVGVLYLARPVGASELVDAPATVAPEEPAPAGEPTIELVPIEPRLEVASAEPATPAAIRRATAATRPPAPRPTLYDVAAARYGLSPLTLRALHQVESSGARSGCPANRQGSGALGPLQFMPATFAGYGVDADGDGRKDICGLADSLFSAARYLKALGATADPTSWATQQALARYGTDVAAVLALAR